MAFIAVGRMSEGCKFIVGEYVLFHERGLDLCCVQLRFAVPVFASLDYYWFR